MSFLHVCGGDPWYPKPACCPVGVFSTYVEVILNGTIDEVNSGSFLHVCGGDPNQETSDSEETTFSPRMWR